MVDPHVIKTVELDIISAELNFKMSNILIDESLLGFGGIEWSEAAEFVGDAPDVQPALVAVAQWDEFEVDA